MSFKTGSTVLLCRYQNQRHPTNRTGTGTGVVCIPNAGTSSGPQSSKQPVGGGGGGGGSNGGGGGSDGGGGGYVLGRGDAASSSSSLSSSSGGGGGGKKEPLLPTPPTSHMVKQLDTSLTCKGTYMYAGLALASDTRTFSGQF